MLQSLNLPTRTQLWNHAILTTIDHAIWVAEIGANYSLEWRGLRDSLREHGGFLVEDALLEIGEAIANEQKRFSTAQAQLLERLFYRRMEAADHSIMLAKDDIAILKDHGKADLQASLEVLMCIGILYPWQL